MHLDGVLCNFHFSIQFFWAFDPLFQVQTLTNFRLAPFVEDNDIFGASAKPIIIPISMAIHERADLIDGALWGTFSAMNFDEERFYQAKFWNFQKKWNILIGFHHVHRDCSQLTPMESEKWWACTTTGCGTRRRVPRTTNTSVRDAPRASFQNWIRNSSIFRSRNELINWISFDGANRLFLFAHQSRIRINQINPINLARVFDIAINSSLPYYI